MAYDFEALKARVRDISYTPGTDALRHISPLLLQAQDLTATALVRLTALDNSTYTNIAGSRAAWNCWPRSCPRHRSPAPTWPTSVLANPYEDAQFAGYPADDEAVRTVRHAEAIPRMNGHLDDAVHQFDLCAIGCHYLAHGITDELATAQEHKPPAVQQTTGPALTAAQYDALTALNGGGRLYESTTRSDGQSRRRGAGVVMARLRHSSEGSLPQRPPHQSLAQRCRQGQGYMSHVRGPQPQRSREELSGGCGATWWAGPL